MGFLVGSRWASNWARVRLLLPLSDAISTVMILAFFTLDWVLNNLETNLAEEKSAGILLSLSESFCMPAQL